VDGLPVSLRLWMKPGDSALQCDGTPEPPNMPSKASQTVRGLPAPSEEQLQIELLHLAFLMEPQCPDLRWLHAIPNGGKRIRSEAARMKAGGVKPGVPDLDLPVGRTLRNTRSYLSLRIEMKKPGGKVSADQQKWINGLRELGHCVQVCWCVESAWAVICWYLSPKWPEMREKAFSFTEKKRLTILGDSPCHVVEPDIGRIWFVAHSPLEAHDFLKFHQSQPLRR
jgi:hypothetical protein